MRGTFLAAAAPLLSIGLTAAAAGAQTPAGIPPVEVRALAVRYDDGRTTTRTLSDRGRVNWTPTFPRVPRAETSRDGLPLFALQFEEALDGDSLVVTVALLYGSPLQRRVQVATARLTDDRAVRVDALEAYGVRPVTLSLVKAPAPSLLLPAVTSVSSLLDVQIDSEDARVPGYRIRVTNRSAKQAVWSMSFRGYRGTITPLSGSPKGRGHTPLIAPGETYELRLPAVTQGRSEEISSGWLPIERFAITSVLWDDGLVEGDPQLAANGRVMDAGTAMQLARAIPLLRGAADAPSEHPVHGLRAAVAGLPVVATADDARRAIETLMNPALVTVPNARSRMASGMQAAKNALLNDIDAFTRSAVAGNPSEYAAWLRAMAEKFDAWHTRIARAPR